MNLSPESFRTFARSRFAKLAAAILFLSAVAATGFGQPVSSPPDAKAKVDQIFARFAKPDSPGCAVGVGIGPTTVLTAAYGMAARRASPGSQVLGGKAYPDSMSLEFRMCRSKCR